MGSPRPAGPADLSDRAARDLRYIRDTMARAGAFTALSGWGFVAVGAGAIATGALAIANPDPIARARLWLIDAAVSVAVGLGATLFKAHRSGQSLRTGPFRKFVLGFGPAVAAGAVLTLAMLRDDHAAYLPTSWLLLYGVGLIGGGAYSVAVVPLMGGGFLALGAIAAVAPAAWGEPLMIAGFGGAHLLFGALIARSHGG
ncbi:MAG TPA: hypothetical protein VMT92_09055 [Steroidobacteraceae bacterium]|nr:hypothetical protein [Steroidobacteraceae bacterium]